LLERALGQGLGAFAFAELAAVLMILAQLQEQFEVSVSSCPDATLLYWASFFQNLHQIRYHLQKRLRGV